MKKMILLALSATFLTACQDSLEERATKEAKLYTQKNCPAIIAKNLRMDSLTFEVASHTLRYYYTFLNEYDTVGVMNNDMAREALLSELKNSTSMIAYKEAGYRFTYTYHSEKNPNVVLFETTYTEKDYK